MIDLKPTPEILKWKEEKNNNMPRSMIEMNKAIREKQQERLKISQLVNSSLAQAKYKNRYVNHEKR